MSDRFLLYIDILGFSNLVSDGRLEEINEVYDALEHHPAHSHYAFKVLVFSDTVLIFNTVEPASNKDRQVIVMYLTEFAQVLHYSFARKGIFFRAVLSYGDLVYEDQMRVTRIFGKALVDAYNTEKALNCTGLFIDEYCRPFNAYLPVTSFNNKYSYVYLNRILERYHEIFPLDAFVLEAGGEHYDLFKELKFLERVFAEMRTHTDQRVREKMLATWDLHMRRYARVLSELSLNDFDLASISSDLDWNRVAALI